MQMLPRFRDLAIDETFDWDGGAYPSFFQACRKVSARTYQGEDGEIYRVGSINAEVYHVGRPFTLKTGVIPWNGR